MRKIKEVLRLKLDVGLGLRQIARSCSIGLGTVHEYVQRAEAAGVTWPLAGIGMKTVWRLGCSAVRHGLARRCCRCQISPSFPHSATAVTEFLDWLSTIAPEPSPLASTSRQSHQALRPSVLLTPGPLSFRPGELRGQ